MTKARALAARIPVLEVVDIGCAVLISAGVWGWSHSGALVTGGVLGCLKVYVWSQPK